MGRKNILPACNDIYEDYVFVTPYLQQEATFKSIPKLFSDILLGGVEWFFTYFYGGILEFAFYGNPNTEENTIDSDYLAASGTVEAEKEITSIDDYLGMPTLLLYDFGIFFLAYLKGSGKYISSVAEMIVVLMLVTFISLSHYVSDFDITNNILIGSENQSDTMNDLNPNFSMTYYILTILPEPEIQCQIQLKLYVLTYLLHNGLASLYNQRTISAKVYSQERNSSDQTIRSLKINNYEDYFCQYQQDVGLEAAIILKKHFAKFKYDVQNLTPARCCKVNLFQLTLKYQTPVNGGRNPDGPKVAKFLGGQVPSCMNGISRRFILKMENYLNILKNQKQIKYNLTIFVIERQFDWGGLLLKSNGGVQQFGVSYFNQDQYQNEYTKFDQSTLGITGLWVLRVLINKPVWHLDVGSSHPDGEQSIKGPAVRRLKWYVSWVQNVVRQFGPYLLQFEENKQELTLYGFQAKLNKIIAEFYISKNLTYIIFQQIFQRLHYLSIFTKRYYNQQIQIYQMFKNHYSLVFIAYVAEQVDAWDLKSHSYGVPVRPRSQVFIQYVVLIRTRWMPRIQTSSQTNLRYLFSKQHIDTLMYWGLIDKDKKQ
ncbi:hypothetical protein ABPG72_001055 [Tetrahymena utriculariae]